MSSYLTIRYGDIVMGCWSRNSSMYQLCEYRAPYGEYSTFDIQTEYRLLEKEAQGLIERNNQSIEKYKDALPFLKTSQEVFDTIDLIESIQDENRTYQHILDQWIFLLEVEENNGALREEDEPILKWSWKID